MYDNPIGIKIAKMICIMNDFNRDMPMAIATIIDIIPIKPIPEVSERFKSKTSPGRAGGFKT
jgi:hypothetical protein